MKKIIISLAVTAFVITACSKTNEVAENENNNGGNPATCDTVDMKYSTDVLPILQANCYGCHGNGQATSGVNFDTYDGVKKQADNSNLIGVITHANGYPAMPLGQPKLSDCDINKIKDWVARGAQNN